MPYDRESRYEPLKVDSMNIGIELCFDDLPTWLLRKILPNDLMNKVNPLLTDEAINHICDILISRFARSPGQATRSSAKLVFKKAVLLLCVY